MQNKIILLFFTILMMFPSKDYAQTTPIGYWRDHFSYTEGIAVVNTDDLVFCATEASIFSYDKKDKTIRRINKLNDLSDNSIITMAYDEESENLFVTYESGAFDIIHKDDVKTVNVIKEKQMPGNKSINKIRFHGDSAFFACGFGVVIYNIKKDYFVETCFIGDQGERINVYDIDIGNDTIYAATDDGIYMANLNSPYLINYGEWDKDTNIIHKDGPFNFIEYFQGNLLVNFPVDIYAADTMYIKKSGKWEEWNDTYNSTKFDIMEKDGMLYVSVYLGVYIFDSQMNKEQTLWSYDGSSGMFPSAIDIDEDGVYWIADRQYGLVKTINSYTGKFFQPEGPRYNDSYKMRFTGEHLWVAAGGVNSTWNNRYSKKGAYSFIDENWDYINLYEDSMIDSTYDYMCAIEDPNDASHVYITTWGEGVIELKDNKAINVFDEDNSSLKASISRPGWVACGGAQFDKNGLLWVSNSGNSNAIHSRLRDGTWIAYDLFPSVMANEVGDILIDNYNQKWIILPRGNGIAVFNDNDTPEDLSDDQHTKLTKSSGSGGLNTTHINCMASDLEGELWLGTEEGIEVVYSPENVFEDRNYDASQIIVERDGVVAPLLKNEIITSIAIDGANRKWVGTQSAGVFLLSEDGLEEIAQFNEDNSSLISNYIICIEINQSTGEVFIGTSLGIVSYRSAAIQGGEEHSNVLVYPNPVKPDYNGTIAIKGLVKNAHVKITDISGTLIYQTTALGGQAVWDGNNFDGSRASSGVYIVYSTDDYGQETFVTKILFLN